MKEKSVKINVVYSVLKSASNVLLPMLLFSYVARVLNPDGLGQVTYVRTIANYFSILAIMGMDIYGVREVARNKEDIDSRTKVTRELCIINFISMIIVAIAYIFVGNFLFASSVNNNIYFIFIIIVIAKPINMEWFLGGIEEYSYTAKRTMAMHLLLFLAALIFVKNESDILKYAIILVLSEIGICVLNITYSQKFLVHKQKYNYEIKKHLKPLLFFCGTVISAHMLIDVDTLMLGYFKGDEAVGIYAAATKLVVALTTVFNGIIITIFSRVSYNAKCGNMSKVDELRRDTVNYILMLTIPAMTGLILLANEVIVIFCGSEYLQAGNIIKVIAMQIVFMPLTAFVQYMFLNIMNDEKKTFLISGCGALFNVIVNMLLIPNYAEMGAAIATVMTQILMLIISLYMIRTQGFVSIICKDIKHYIVANLIMIITGMALLNIVADTFLRIIVCVIILSIVYFISLYLLKNKYLLRSLVFISNKLRRTK